MTTPSTDAAPPIPRLPQPRTAPFRLAIAIPWILVALLVLSNGMTLLNERFHAMAFHLVSSVARLGGDSVAHSVLAHSPEQGRVRAVQEATRESQRQYAALMGRYQELQTGYQAAQAARAAWQREAEGMRALTARRAAMVRGATESIRTKLLLRSANTVRSLPGRSLPYVGIAVQVAFTGWEVKTDCELAQTLSGLAAEHEGAPLDTQAVCKFIDEIPSAKDTWDAIKGRAGTALLPVYAAMERYAQRGKEH